MKLSNQVAVVTGAGDGIGEAVSWRLAKEGAVIIAADINQKSSEKVAKELREAGFKAFPYKVDITLKHEVKQMVNSIEEKFGGIEILANIAGVLGPSIPVNEIEEEDWDKVLDVNLKGTFLCSQAVVTGMVSKGYGRIVNMSSVAGKEGNELLAPYAASKAGVIAFTKSLGKEIAKTGVTVNCITPTMIEGKLIEGMSNDYINFLLSKIPMGRLGKREEVASLVNYLVSDETGFITGQCFDISGGRSVY